MRRSHGKTAAMTVAASVAIAASYGCGSGEARQTTRTASSARSSSSSARMDTPGTTSTTSAALTTGALTTNAATPTASAPPTPPTPPMSVATAVMRVTTEHCDRAVTCKHVGTGRVFGDRDECVNAVGHDVVATLSEEECPSGVEASRLAACVSEVQASPCDGGATPISLPPSCARDRLCSAGLAVQTER